MKTLIRAPMQTVTQHPWISAVLCLIGGAIMPLSLAPFDLWPLGIVSIVLLCCALDQGSPKQAALRGWLYGVGLHGVGVSWVYVSIHEFGNAPVSLSLFLVIFFVCGLALFQILPAYLYAKFFRQRAAGLFLALPALWVLHEWTRVWVFTGFPWLFLGYGHLETPLSGLAPISGVLGISLVVALSGSVLFYLIKYNHSARKTMVYGLGIVFIWLLAGVCSQIPWVEEKDRLKVSLIQANIPQKTKWQPDQVVPIINTYKRLSQDQWAKSDIIVWPEAAITLFYEQAGGFLQQMSAFAQNNNATLITGIPSREKDLDDPSNRLGIFRNTAIAIGQGSGVYQKQRLVPFGEYVPLESLLRGFIEFFDLPMSHAKSGPAHQKGLMANGYTIAMSICYEVVYADLVALTTENPDLLMTISNDIWFGRSLGPLQHLQMAQMRALENGRYMVRSTNNGISAIIDERGTLLQRSGQFTQEVIFGEAKIMSGRTPFSKLGSWPTIVLCFSLLLLTIIRDYLPSKPHRRTPE